MKITTITSKYSPIVLIAILLISCESKPPASSVPPSPAATPPGTTSNANNSNKDVRSGKFVSVAYPVSGQATLITKGDKVTLEFDDNFKTANGPDLRIVFHKAPDLSSVAAPPNYGIDPESYVVLVKLQNTSGKQVYEIPQGTKLQNFKSVAIWCAKMNKIYGFATLQ